MKGETGSLELLLNALAGRHFGCFLFGLQGLLDCMAKAVQAFNGKLIQGTFHKAYEFRL